MAFGIAGTGWLSALTTDWDGPPARYAQTRHASPASRTLPSSTRSPVPGRVVRTRRPPPTIDRNEALASVPAPPDLVPLATPADTSQPWYKLRGHLDGHVLLHVEVDAGGRVSAASVLESSGDAVLDEHALRSVRGWRFAVPADHPDGMAGKLPMQFSSQGDRVARVP